MRGVLGRRFLLVDRSSFDPSSHDLSSGLILYEIAEKHESGGR
jgi:hypothetical protein